MNLLLWFLVWAVVFYLPFSLEKSKLLSRSRIVSLLFGFLMFYIYVAMRTPESILFYWLVFWRFLVGLVEVLFQIPSLEEVEERLYTYRLRRRPKPRFSAKVSALILAIFLLGSSLGIVFSQVQRVSNAFYFKSLIQVGSGLPFSREIPDDMVRLVTEELAVSMARQRMSEFGSNVKLLGCQITKNLDGKLVWVAVIGSTNVLAENYVKGFVVIDATDPTATPQIIHQEFKVGEGLWWTRNIKFKSYVADTRYSYGVAYPCWNNITNELTYVLARYRVGFDLIRRYNGLLIYGPNGEVVNEYSRLSDVPNWVTQVYDEDWLENMINEWGNFRRGESFDYWAGGFLWIIPPSRDRVEMSEDTRYILDPDTGDLIAMVCLNPVTSERTLAGIFKATRQGIFFYDYSKNNYISGVTAQDVVEGKLPKPAAGYYYATMPLLYPVQVGEGDFRLAWYVPIYWSETAERREGETIYLAGFAIVDAQNINYISIKMTGGGMKGEELVRSTRTEFLGLFGKITYIELNTTVLNKSEYVKDGVTHIVLHVDNSTYPYIEAEPEDLSSQQQWYELLLTGANDQIIAHIEKRGEIWVITYFDNLSLE